MTLASARALVASWLLLLAGPALGQPVASVTTRTPHPEREWPAELEAAATAGDPIAATKLGMAYEYGWNVPHDPEQAARWFVEAAKKGEPHALMRLGRVFEVPEHGVAPDHRKARELYERAAARGDPFATSRLYARGWREGGYEEALRWVRLAADAGDPLAFHYMYKYLQHGMGTAKDPAEAARWTLRGVQRGDLRSLSVRGDELEAGGHLEDAFALHEEAALRGAPYAQTQVAQALDGGRGVPPDPFAARAWARRAALGNAAGAELAGLAALRGIGGPRDLEEGLALVRRAAAIGDAGADAELAWALAVGAHGLKADPAAGRARLEELVAAEGWPGHHELARLLLDGVGGPADPARARELLAPLGWNAPVNDLGVLLLLGRGGPADPARGRALLCKAARGHPIAMANLAQLLEGDPSRAARGLWYAAAQRGQPFAIARVARLLRSGELLPGFPGEAALWEARAARVGSPPAPLLLSGPSHRLRTAAEDAAWWREGFEAGSAQDGIHLLRQLAQGGAEGEEDEAPALLARLRALPDAARLRILDVDDLSAPLLDECALLEAALAANGGPGRPADASRARALYTALGSRDRRAFLPLGQLEESLGNLEAAATAFRRSPDPLAQALLRRVERHLARQPTSRVVAPADGRGRPRPPR